LRREKSHSVSAFGLAGEKAAMTGYGLPARGIVDVEQSSPQVGHVTREAGHETL